MDPTQGRRARSGVDDERRDTLPAYPAFGDGGNQLSFAVSSSSGAVPNTADPVTVGRLVQIPLLGPFI
jgi:hypothetical protein